MDFIDNLLNHMSSKFNQESTLPKQSEISMDETFKWRALKNNQFASRSKNSRSKIKSKDKGKQDGTNSELNMSSYENKTSDNFEYPTVADANENTDIEIEIANDISGAEIQEVLAATQGHVSSILEAVSEIQDNSIVEPSDIEAVVEGSICSTPCEPTNNEAIETLSRTENGATLVESDSVAENLPTNESVIVETNLERKNSEINEEKHNNTDTAHIFIHMSSTFNATGLVKNSSEQLTQIEDPQQMKDAISSSDGRAPGNKNSSGEDHEDIPSTTSVRRSKRLKPDQSQDAESTEAELLTTHPISAETSSSVSKFKEAKEATDEQIISTDEGKPVGDNTVRILRNKSFEVKLVESEAKVKSTAKKKHKNETKEQESPHKMDIAEKQHPVSSDLRKITRSKTILRKIPAKRRTQYLRSSYPTRQRNPKLDKKSEIRKSRFWNTKNKTKKSVRASSDSKTKHLPENPKETANARHPKERSPKRSNRLSRDGSDGILASAIARREKNDTNGFQGRLSRPIKLSAKILANDELRYGFELQNNARLNLHVEVKEPITAKESMHSNADSNIRKPELSEETDTKVTELPPSTCEPPKCVTPQPQLCNAVIKCPDPMEFLNDVKRNNFGSNNSPESNSKLTKMQQKKLHKLKEKHFFMLGLKKITNQQILPDKYVQTISVNKEATEACIDLVEETISPKPIEHVHEIKDDTSFESETTDALPTSQHPSKFLCSCQKDTRYFTTKSKCRMYCTATDDIDGQLVGCCNELKGGLQNLLRPSSSASYQLLCLTHQRRLHHHGCCATCGVYCTQGYFVICSNKHLFHKECAEKFIVNTKGKSSPIIPKLVLKCPHCGLESVIREYKVRLQKSLSFSIVMKRH